MRLHWRHGWNVSPARARDVQLRGVGRVSLESRLGVEGFRRSGLLAALDVAYDSRRDMCFAALVLWDVADASPIRTLTHAARSTFPYVPGLLSFREIPPLIPLLRRLPRAPDLLLCDGQGIAHPRRFGLASHLGVLYDCPALGWAKSRLIGEHRPPEQSRGSATRLIDRGEAVGWVLRSRRACRPTFVSPGHGVSLGDSLRLARALLGPYRLCEPARAAHELTRRAMNA